MADKVKKYKMDIIEERYERESGWSERVTRTQTTELRTYQSINSGDTTVNTLQEKESNQYKSVNNGNTTVKALQDMENNQYKSVNNGDTTVKALQDEENNNNNYSSKGNTTRNRIKSSIEVKIEKHVELVPKTYRSELSSVTSSVGDSPADDAFESDSSSESDTSNDTSDTSTESGNGSITLVETDNRVAVKQVEMAVIETNHTGVDDIGKTASYHHPDSIIETGDMVVLKPETAELENIDTNHFNADDGHVVSTIETDNRIAIKQVETAVIDTSDNANDGVNLSCDMSDIGPEIQEKSLLETDIDTLGEDSNDYASSVYSTDDNVDDLVDIYDSGDYKIVGTDTDSLEFRQLVHAIETGSVVSLESLGFTDESSREKHTEYRDESSTDTVGYSGEFCINGGIVHNTTDDSTSTEHYNMKLINRHVSDGGLIGRRRLESQTLDVIVENGEAENDDDDDNRNFETRGNGNDKTMKAESSTKLTGLRINQYKITQNFEETVTTKTEVITDMSTDVVDTDVTMREVSGRDMRKVKRELKLNIPNNNNNNIDKTAHSSSDMSQGIGVCCRCGEGFGTHQQIVNSNGEIWHPQCFVCAQCFQPFPEGIFYEYEGRKYCEHDFHVLFAPCCGKCGEFIVGRVIKAMNNAWHPDCFRCQLCTGPLADAGFVKNAGRALCRECNAKEKARGMGKYVCHKCHSIIEEGHIKFKGEAFHPYHFNCNTCSTELNADAREVNGELYCLRCHDKMGIPICGACRRPIEERVVHALGKAWHVEHFVCAKCEKPFFGTRHYEKKGLAYCEVHYHQLFGNICFTCNSVISGDVFHAFNKAWHVNHFACSICDRKMSQKTKFFEFDLKPVCKFCYEKFPGELKKRLKKAYEEQGAKK